MTKKSRSKATKVAIVFTRATVAENNYSLKAQKSLALDYCKNHNITVLKEITITGNTTESSEWLDMEHIIEQLKHPVLLVVDSVSRLIRNLHEFDCINRLVDNHKLVIHYIRENLTIDKSIPKRIRYIYNMQLFLANHYRACMSQKVKEAWKRRKTKRSS